MHATLTDSASSVQPVLWLEEADNPSSGCREEGGEEGKLTMYDRKALEFIDRDSLLTGNASQCTIIHLATHAVSSNSVPEQLEHQV